MGQHPQDVPRLTTTLEYTHLHSLDRVTARGVEPRDRGRGGACAVAVGNVCQDFRLGRRNKQGDSRLVHQQKSDLAVAFLSSRYS